jgi:hypothetical protein
LSKGHRILSLALSRSGAFVLGEPALGVDRGHAAVPAAVTAWRYVGSIASPHANTPSTEVRVPRSPDVPGRVEIDLAAEQLGVRLVADRDEQRLDRELTVRAVSRLRIRTPVTHSSPSTSSTAEFQTNSIFSFFARALLHDLRGAQRVAAVDHLTRGAKRVRNSASSIAVSPPPTTAIALPR